MFVAQAEGLYAKCGVDVKLVPVAMAPEWDQLLQARQAEGALNEILSVMFINRNEIRMVLVFVQLRTGMRIEELLNTRMPEIHLPGHKNELYQGQKCYTQL